MQVMARAGNTVFLRVEVKEANLEIFSVYAFTAKKISGKRPKHRPERLQTPYIFEKRKAASDGSALKTAECFRARLFGLVGLLGALFRALEAEFTGISVGALSL